jgi:polar amino acid transport system ATP-binding protein
MDAGVVVESGPPEQFFTSPRTVRLQGFLADVL